MADNQYTIVTNQNVPTDELDLQQCTDEVIEFDNNELKATSKMRTKEERELEAAVCEYQEGNKSIFEKIYKIYRPKFDRLSYRMNNEDITQELSIALLKAVRTFKTGMPAKFNTYFWKIARNHIGTMNIKNNAKKRTADGGVVSIHSVINVDGSEIEFGDMIEDETFGQQFEDATLRAFLHNTIFPHMKDLDKQALQLYLKGYTLEEIGNRLGGMSAPAIHVKIKQLKSREIIYKAICKYFEDQGYNIKKLKAGRL